jgi:hypothetical protein
MNGELGLAIRNILQDLMRSVAWWRETIARLIAEFERTIGEQCSHDDDPTIDIDAPSFNIWLWSMPQDHSLLSPSWSGVMAGGLLAGDEFVITVDVFLFHSKSRSRLQTMDGRSFIEFSFDTEVGEWKCNGWIRDEWGEWEGVAFPDAE